MGLTEFVGKQIEKKEIKQFKLDQIASNPRFAGMNPSKISFQPIDGDVDRMTMYGCYAGDKFTYEGKTYEVEKDDVERIKVTPYIDIKKEFDKIDVSELNAFERRRYQQLEEEGRRRIYAQKLIAGDCVETDTFRLTYRSVTRRIYDIRDEIEQEWQETGWRIECTDKKTPMKDVVMPDKLFGDVVAFASHCFEGCMNVASVKHISKCLTVSDMAAMFYCSGLREMPKELIQEMESNPYRVDRCIDGAYAMKDYTKIKEWLEDKDHRSTFSYDAIGTRNNRLSIQDDIKRVDANKEKDLDEINGELATFVKFESVSFMHKFQPVTVIRGQTSDGQWYAVDPQMKTYDGIYRQTMAGISSTAFVPFDLFMKVNYKNEDIQNLSTGRPPIETITKEEFTTAVIEAYNYAYDKLNGMLNKIYAERDEICANEIESADKAQEGLDFTPRDDSDLQKILNPIQKDEHMHDEEVL